MKRTRLRPLIRFVSTSVVSLSVLTGLAVWSPTAFGQAHGPATDTRQQVRLTAAEVNAIRAEMRQMLSSVSGVVGGLASGDLAGVETAAKASGIAAAVDPHLEQKLPRQFLELGERTHRGFDDLATAARARAPAADLLERLAGVTSSCVACHALYRLGEAR